MGAQLKSSRVVTHSARLIGMQFEKPAVNGRTMLTFALEMQRWAASGHGLRGSPHPTRDVRERNIPV